MTKEEQIRKRVSYNMFANILKAFDISKKDGITYLFHIMDDKCFFRSRSRAMYAQESLNQLLIDKNLESWTDTQKKN